MKSEGGGLTASILDDVKGNIHHLLSDNERILDHARFCQTEWQESRQCPYSTTLSCPSGKISALLKKALDLQEKAHMIHANVHPPFGIPPSHYGGKGASSARPQKGGGHLFGPLVF